MEANETVNTDTSSENIGNVADPVDTLPKIDLPDDIGNKAEPEWKPNLKVKAYDKEFDIPEKFHALINKENEKEFRDVHEKAFALDVMKEKNAKIREQNEVYQQRIEKELMPVVGNYKKLEKFLANDDYDSFFANIPAIEEKKLQSWMLRKLQLKDLPADQQALYNEERAARQRAYQLEEENTQYKQKFEELSTNNRQAAIDNTLKQLDDAVSSPELNSIAKEFDSRLGQDGSFKMEVLQRAAILARQLQRDVTIEEAVQDFMKVTGLAGTSNLDPAAPKTTAPKPTLPSLNGKSTSPATKKITSLDDLRKISKNIVAQQSRQSRE